MKAKDRADLCDSWTCSVQTIYRHRVRIAEPVKKVVNLRNFFCGTEPTQSTEMHPATLLSTMRDYGSRKLQLSWMLCFVVAGQAWF